MKNQIKLILAVLVALLSFSAYADPNPHYYIPSVCTPPTGPAPGQPGYGASNPLPNGIYYDPVTGYWVIPNNLWTGPGEDGSDSERDIYIAALIEDSLPPPSRPDWAIFDMESDGTYYWGGGYYNGHYFAEGYYLPTEIS